MEKDLPKGWIETTLGEILNYQKGKKPRILKDSWFKDSLPYLDIKAFEKGEVVRFADVASSNIVDESSLVIVWDGARSGWVSKGKLGAIGSTLAKLSPVESDVDFVLYFLKSKFNYINSNTRGTGIPHVDPEILWNISFPLPPLQEQKRIVAKLDTLFASLENTKARLEKIPILIKNFKQAILTQAVTGKLTEQWREGKELEDMNQFVKDLSIQRKYKYEEAVLYAKKTKSKKPKKDFDFEFKNHPDKKDWCVAKLENLIYMSARIGWKGLKADEYTSEGPLFLSVHGLNYGENVNFDVAYHITEERYTESPEIMLEENDILLCKDGAGIGKLGVVKGLKEKATVNSSLLVIRGREALNYKFLYYFFAGPALQNIVKERITGTAIPHLFQKDIKEFYVEIPPLKEQTEIVRRVESLFAKADAIEAQYTKLKQKIDTLPQAILAKAFRGELVEQNPLDEPASILLEKIQSLRQAQCSAKSKKKVVRKKKSVIQ